VVKFHYHGVVQAVIRISP